MNLRDIIIIAAQKGIVRAGVIIRSINATKIVLIHAILDTTNTNVAIALVRAFFVIPLTV